MFKFILPLMAADESTASASEQWNTFLSQMGRLLAEAGWRLITLIAVLVIGIILIRFVTQIIRKAFLKTKLNSTLGVFFMSIIKFVLYIVLVFILAGIAKISMTPLITVLGAASLVVSLAVQDTISNVANGVMIIATKPFRIGDHVSVNGQEGVVKSIRMTYTELLTFNNQKIVIPNTRVTSDNIINFTARPTRRVDMTFTIALPDDFDRVKELVNNIMIGDPRTFDDPEPQIIISEFKDNYLTFIVRCWVKTGDYWDVYNETIEKVFNAFRENGVEIDYNKVKLEMQKELKNEEEDK